MIPKSCRLFGQDHATRRVIRAKWRFDLTPFALAAAGAPPFVRPQPGAAPGSGREPSPKPARPILRRQIGPMPVPIDGAIHARHVRQCRRTVILLSGDGEELL